MIHGKWGNGDYWENYRHYFESLGYTVLTPTLRYHEQNPTDEPHPKLGTTSLLDYCEDLEAQIRSLDEKPIIMGHSMGALLTQILASRNLGSAYVLITPASPAGIMALMPSVIKSFAAIMLKWGFWRKPHRQSFEAAQYSRLHLIPETEQRNEYANDVYESGRASFEIGFWLLDSRNASSVDETKISQPMLIISGLDDRITPNSIHKKIASKYAPVAELKEYENHAHSIIHEPGGEEIAKDIEEWIIKLV